MYSEYQDILDACKSNDVLALKKLFSERDIGPDDWKPPKNVPVESFLLAAGFRNHKADIFEYLGSYFSGAQLSSWLLMEAMDVANVSFVAAACKLDPGIAHFDDEGTILGLACGRSKNPEIVKILLDAGARPDDRSGHPLPTTDWYLVHHGLPAITLEYFFDAGYTMAHGPPIAEAVKLGRVDLVEVFYRRGRKLRNSAYLPGAEELMKMAKKSKDIDMIAMVRQLFPEKYSKRQSIFGRIFGKQRLRRESLTLSKSLSA